MMKSNCSSIVKYLGWYINYVTYLMHDKVSKIRIRIYIRKHIFDNNENNYILGAVNSDASVWIVMELMLTCFDKILKTLRMPIPVQVLGSLSVSVVQALNYLKEKHSTIHRDGNPRN